MNRAHEPGRPPLALGALLGLAGIKLAIHLALAGRYGFFRDELYFLDCGRHLDWGYVDHAPLIGLVARAALALGGSLPALRLFPALAGAGLVALTMLIARELGGRRFAQALSGVAVLACPIVLAIDSLMTMNAFEPLFWMGGVFCVLRIVRGGDSRWWLAFGALAGLGLQNKHSTLFFGAAVALAVLLTPLRRELRRPWIWLGALLAMLLFLPNVAWQALHGFPTLEDLRNVKQAGKNVQLGPLAFLAQQVLIVHPLLAPIWLGGLVSLLVGRLRRFAFVGWTYLALLGIFIVLHGKNYYLAPAYPMLFAAGAVALEDLLDRLAIRRWAHAIALTWVALAGATVAPLVLPLLPPERFLSYQRALGLEPPKTEVAHDGPLPQMFGDQFGWPELVAEVAAIYRSLPEHERRVAAIFANNYGEAGAINHLGQAYGLPPAISGHQTHFFWGPGDASSEVIIVLQGDREDLERRCASVEEAGRHFHPWGMAEENRPIHVCRGLHPPLQVLWPEVKHWN